MLYVARYKKAVYVLHAFQKQTQQITQKDLKIARKAYAQIKNDANEKNQRSNTPRGL
ncbi:MAG: type II toxin-antitoxin system RelE/ParE family toxin [Candidatus Melainabacteria bacterium]|nr:type II toxin-antitoxin system RelE/ParE family toxin [Candidatus Melainabacteria bacterium]